MYPAFFFSPRVRLSAGEVKKLVPSLDFVEENRLSAGAVKKLVRN